MKMATITVVSTKRGSNPGGNCIVPYRGSSIDAYIKYANNSRLPRAHPFTPENQPVYEAVTLALAEQLGLQIPRNFVVINDESIGFEHHTAIKRSERIAETRPRYFLSKLVTEPETKDETLEERMKEEKIYRDLLMIGDISGKKQNYAFIHDDSHPHVLYIDLGCNFVDAVSGKISQRNAISKLTRDRNGEEKPNLKRELKLARSYLERHGIRTAHKEEYRQDIVQLTGFIDNIPQLAISMYPSGTRIVKDLLSKEELQEIMNLLTLNMTKVLREYNKKGTHSHLIINQKGE